MKSSISLFLGGACSVLPFAAPTLWAQTQDAAPSAIQVVHPEATAPKKTFTGTVTITAVLTTNKDLPAGTMVNLSGSASVFDTAFTNSHSVSTVAKVAGGKISVTIKIPYTFLVTTTSDKVSIGLSASTFAASSGPSYSFSTNFNSLIALPANGKATAVRFSGSI